MTDEIIDTAVGSIMIAITLIVSVQILFPSVSISIINDIFSEFVKLLLWVTLIAVLVSAIQDKF